MEIHATNETLDFQEYARIASIQHRACRTYRGEVVKRSEARARTRAFKPKSPTRSSTLPLRTPSRTAIPVMAPGNNQGYPSTLNCYNCGEASHLSRDCRKPKQARAAAITGDEEPDAVNDDSDLSSDASDEKPTDLDEYDFSGNGRY